MIAKTLYLIPIPLSQNTNTANATIPTTTSQILETIDGLFVENKKTARSFIKQLYLKRKIQNLPMVIIDKNTHPTQYKKYLQLFEHNPSWGLMSEAGCPGIADPGAEFIRLAHKEKIRVIPLVGPSAIFLALMASGLPGQRFCFHGYVPIDKKSRVQFLRLIERVATEKKQTQIFMETPYRNQQVLEDIVATLHPATDLCIATDITLPTEYIVTRSIVAWRQKSLPHIDNRPTIFLLNKSILV